MLADVADNTAHDALAKNSLKYFPLLQRGNENKSIKKLHVPTPAELRHPNINQAVLSVFSPLF